jgi:hypothetical protein
MEVFNSDHGSNILGCGNLCTAGSQIFKTNEFTWFSEVNYFQCSIFFLNRDIICERLNLEGVKIHYGEVQKIGDLRFDANHWNKFMEVSVEKKMA